MMGLPSSTGDLRAVAMQRVAIVDGLSLGLARRGLRMHEQEVGTYACWKGGRLLQSMKT